MDKFDIMEEFLLSMKNKIDKVIRKKRRLYFNVKNEDLHTVVSYLFHTMGCRLSTATAMETYEGIEVLYQFSYDPGGSFFCSRVIIYDKKNPLMNSIAL